MADPYYTGLLIDGQTVRLSVCSVCKAAVQRADQYGHTSWHRENARPEIRGVAVNYLGDKDD